MESVQIASTCQRLKKAQSTNSTATSFTALIPTATKPAASATRAVFDRGDAVISDPEIVQNTIIVLPYGGNTNNDVVNYKVSGWNRTYEEATGAVQWISTLVCEVQGTLSSSLLGTAGGTVAAAEFFCDTLTLTTGIAVLVQGTADVDIARFEANVAGYELVEITYDLGAGGDLANALVRFSS